MSHLCDVIILYPVHNVPDPKVGSHISNKRVTVYKILAGLPGFARIQRGIKMGVGRVRNSSNPY